MGGCEAKANDRVWLDSGSVSVEGGIPFPPPSHRIEGYPSKIFLPFSLQGVCLADGNASRKRLEALCWLRSSGWLPLLRVDSLKGSERIL
jgi:hypothetical protein